MSETTANIPLRTAAELALEGAGIPRASRSLARPQPDLNRVGFTGLRRFGGLISEEYLPALSGCRKIDIYTKMRSDGMVEAMLTALCLPVIAATWTVEPAGDDANAKRAAELVEDNLRNHLADCWEEEVRKLLTHLHYGFAVSAEQWGVEKGTARLTELLPLHPRSILQGGKNWDLDAQGTLRGVWQYGTDGATWRDEYIPASRLLHLVRNGDFKNPEGMAVLRAPYKHWLIKDSVYRFQAIGLERTAVGVPIAIYDPLQTPPNKQTEIENFVRNMAVYENGYGTFPLGTELKNFALELKTADIMAAIHHHDAEMAKSILAGFLNLGQEGNGGAYALSADATDLFLLGLEAIGNYIAAKVTRGPARKIVQYNVATDQFPKVSCTISRRSAAALATLIRPLVAGQNAPVTWGEADEDWLREELHLPARVEKRPKRVEPKAPGQPGQPPQPGQKQEPQEPQQQSRRERIELKVFAEPPQFQEEPAYPELGEVAEQFRVAYVPLVEELRADLFTATGLPQPAELSRFDARFDARTFALTEAQKAAIEAALNAFLNAFAGEDRTETGFVGGDAEDGLLQSYLRLGHAVGVNHIAAVQGATPLAAVTRESPQVARVLTHAFRRLTKQGQQELGDLTKVREILTAGQLRGANPLEVGKKLSKELDDLAGWKAERLARTEMSFAANQGSLDECGAQGVTHVEPVISGLACAVCQAHHGDRIPIAEAVPGVNVAPYHPHCMDSFAPASPE